MPPTWIPVGFDQIHEEVAALNHGIVQQPYTGNKLLLRSNLQPTVFDTFNPIRDPIRCHSVRVASIARLGCSGFSLSLVPSIASCQPVVPLPPRG